MLIRTERGRRLVATQDKNASGYVAILATAMLLMSGPLPAAVPSQDGAPSQTPEPQTEAPPEAPREIAIGSHSKLSFYGFARLDLIYDDSRPNDPQTPTFIPSESPGSEDDDSFTLHPRLTRLGMDFDGPKLDGLGGAELSGKLEIDFQNGGRESRAAPRFRHAYLKLDWGRWHLLGGNTWEILSPLYPTVNADTLMWNAGNLGDRRGQIRAGYLSDGDGVRFEFAGGIGLTGAVNAQDLDGDGLLDGEDSGRPTLQARFGVRFPSGAVGVSAHDASEEVDDPIAGRRDLSSEAIAVDFKLDLTDRLALKGEAWSGEGLGDVRGGAGQTVNPETGREIAAEGGWIELGLEVSPRYSAYVGYTIDDPDDADVPVGGRIENSAVYLVNRFAWGPAFSIGLDYLNWTTEFNGLPDGDDNRFNLYFTYRF